LKFSPNIKLVAEQVARFSAETMEAWEACLSLIIDDPTPRFGTFTTKDVPIREYPSRTWVYEISSEVSISGEVLHVFSSETLPEFLIVYIIDEQESEIVVVSLRDNPRV
jgi:hypothetical protein